MMDRQVGFYSHVFAAYFPFTTLEGKCTEIARMEGIDHVSAVVCALTCPLKRACQYMVTLSVTCILHRE